MVSIHRYHLGVVKNLIRGNDALPGSRLHLTRDAVFVDEVLRDAPAVLLNTSTDIEQHRNGLGRQAHKPLGNGS